ncbi:MAG: hypothetical protein LAT83_23760 [Kiritimatiellae bacterium]|nr:hypothetical protein [Kiritimatiellia bacterium]
MKRIYVFVFLFSSVTCGDESFVLNYMQQKYLPSSVESFDYIVTHLGYKLNYDDMISVRKIEVKLFEQNENVKWYLCRLMTIDDFAGKKGARDIYLARIDKDKIVEIDSHESFLMVVNTLSFGESFDYKTFRELVDLYCKVLSYTPIKDFDKRISRKLVLDEFRKFDDDMLKWDFKENESATFSVLNSSRRILMNFSVSVREDNLSIDLIDRQVFSYSTPARPTFSTIRLPDLD